MELTDYLALDYPLNIIPQDKRDANKYRVEFPDLRGAFGFGDTIEEAIQDAMKVKKVWLEGMLEEGLIIPLPGEECSETIELQISPELHEWLVETAANESLTVDQFINQIVLEAKQLKATIND